MYLLMNVSAPGNFTPEPDIAIIHLTPKFKNALTTRRARSLEIKNVDPGLGAIQYQDKHIHFLEGIADIENHDWWPIDEELVRSAFIFCSELPPFLKEILDSNTNRSTCGTILLSISADSVWWESSYKSNQFNFRTSRVPIDKIPEP